MRVEYLSDIVFALAFGMLVSSGQEPRTFSELNTFLFSAVPVTFGFIFMVFLWTQHFMFFRRYGLADSKTMFLNACVLLVVLFIAYPLRFIFDALFGWILLMAGNSSVVDVMEITYEASGRIMAYFAGGLVIINVLFALMYGHARSLSDKLELDEGEKRLTIMSFWIFVLGALWAALACVLALVTPIGGFAGFVMSLSRLSSRFLRWKFRVEGDCDETVEASDPSSLQHQTLEEPAAPAPGSSPVLRRDR